MRRDEKRREEKRREEKRREEIRVGDELKQRSRITFVRSSYAIRPGCHGINSIR